VCKRDRYYHCKAQGVYTLAFLLLSSSFCFFSSILILACSSLAFRFSSFSRSLSLFSSSFLAFSCVFWRSIDSFSASFLAFSSSFLAFSSAFWRSLNSFSIRWTSCSSKVSFAFLALGFGVEFEVAEWGMGVFTGAELVGCGASPVGWHNAISGAAPLNTDEACFSRAAVVEYSCEGSSNPAASQVRFRDLGDAMGSVRVLIGTSDVECCVVSCVEQSGSSRVEAAQSCVSLFTLLSLLEAGVVCWELTGLGVQEVASWLPRSASA